MCQRQFLSCKDASIAGAAATQHPLGGLPHLVDARGVFHRVFGGGDTGWLGSWGGGKLSVGWPSEFVDSCGKDWLRENTRSLRAIPNVSVGRCADGSQVSVSRAVVTPNFDSATRSAEKQQSCAPALIARKVLLQVLHHLVQALELFAAICLFHALVP